MIEIDSEIRHVTPPGANLFQELGFPPAEAQRLQAASQKQINTQKTPKRDIDLGYPEGEAAVLALRADLMGRLRLLMQEEGWTQVQAAQRFGIAQSRVSDLVRGKWDKFSLDMLITLAARAGRRVKLALHA